MKERLELIKVLLGGDLKSTSPVMSDEERVT